jgi:hypothetical protein
MPYNEELDTRINETMTLWNTTRKKMFGGTCYLINGNMMCGIYQDYLILRLDDTAATEALKQTSVKKFDITGKPMKGWIMVEAAACAGKALFDWLMDARTFAESLPAK